MGVHSSWAGSGCVPLPPCTYRAAQDSKDLLFMPVYTDRCVHATTLCKIPDVIISLLHRRREVVVVRSRHGCDQSGQRGTMGQAGQ